MERETLPAVKDRFPRLFWLFFALIISPSAVTAIVGGDNDSLWHWLLTCTFPFAILAALERVRRRWPHFFHQIEGFARKVSTGSLQAWSLKGLMILFAALEIPVVLAAIQGGWRLLLVGTAGTFLFALYLWTLASLGNSFSKRHKKATFFDACLFLGVVVIGFVGLIKGFDLIFTTIKAFG